MSLNGSESIIKADARGRMRRPASKRQEIMVEFDQSGLSGVEFARLTGINYKTFCGWRNKYDRQKAAQAEAKSKLALAPKMHWIEAVVEKNVSASLPSPPVSNKSTLVIRFASGAHLDLNDLSQTSMAAALLRAMEKQPC